MLFKFGTDVEVQDDHCISYELPYLRVVPDSVAQFDRQTLAKPCR